jgi:hypothetical protein
MTNKKKELRFTSKTIAAGGNAKTIKGDKEYLTAIMYLAPYKTLVGHNTCSMAELAGCHEACLFTAGRGSMNSVKKARIEKTKRYYTNKDKFLKELKADIERFVKYCDRNNVKPVVRLNGTSDIRWENDKVYDKNIFEHFPLVRFYDYTKIANRKVKNIKNYHLTWSYSEASDKYAAMHHDAIKYGMNIAVVFRNADNIPENFLNIKVIDGDKDDLRFLDEKNCIVALYAKGKGKHDMSGFVIDAEKNQ